MARQNKSNQAKAKQGKTKSSKASKRQKKTKGRQIGVKGVTPRQYSASQSNARKRQGTAFVPNRIVRKRLMIIFVHCTCKVSQ